MPAKSSGKKAARQSPKRHLRNRSVESFVRGAIRKAERFIEGKEIPEAQPAVRESISALDRAAKKGVLHPNNVARRKSRLMKKLNTAVRATAKPVRRPRSPRATKQT